MEWKQILIIFVLFVFSSTFIIQQNFNYAEQITDNQITMNKYQHDIAKDLENIRGSLACEDNLSHIRNEVTGHYMNPPDQIRIYIKGANFTEAYETFLHEWGHHIWYEEFDNETQSSFCNLNFTEYVSDYANTNCEENFAETYVYWKLDKQLPDLQAEWFKENMT